MAHEHWTILDTLRSKLEGQTSKSIDQKLDRHVLAALEDAADLIPQGARELMLEGAEEAKMAMNILSYSYSAKRDDPSFLLGRLASLIDILVISAQRCAPSEHHELASDQKYHEILKQLDLLPLSNSELATKIGESSETVCRKLGQLREVGMVLSTRKGRKVVNVVSPAARALLAEGRGGAVLVEYKMRKLCAAPGKQVPASDCKEPPPLGEPAVAPMTVRRHA